MAWQKLKQLLGIRITAIDADDASIQQLVNNNLPNRRQNIRVNYPKIGAGGPFPHVYFNEMELLIGNISTGGCLVIDDTNQSDSTVGEVIPLDFVWPSFRVRKHARIVGITHDHRHFQFVDFNAKFFLQINQLVPPAMVGQRFHRVGDNSGRLAAAEMWTSQSNDTLVFHHDGFVVLTIKGEKILWNLSRSADTGAQDTKMSVTQLSFVYVLLSNLPNPSVRVMSLIEKLATRLAILENVHKRDGTDG